MRARDRNNYTNRACRDLMRVQKMIREADNYENLFTALIARRVSEAALQALRFRYRQPSTWDILFQ